jgi:uncharacterized protein YukE
VGQAARTLAGMAHLAITPHLIADAAAKIRADHYQLRAIADVFSREADCVGSAIALVNRQTEVLRGGDWIGPGARVFFAEMDGAVLPALRRLAGSLLQASRASTRIQAVFQAAETDAARVLTGLPVVAGAGRNGAVDWIADVLDQALDRQGEQSGGNPAVDEILYEGFTHLPFGGEAFVDPDGEGGEGAIDITDIDQGSLGDCYFMAALGALAASDPDQIKQAIVAEDATTCTVRLYEHGIAGPVAREIVVDKTFLSSGMSGGFASPEFAGFGDTGSLGPELWPALLEKAYAQMEGGYGEIVGGKSLAAFRAITGNPGERIGPRQADFDELHELLGQ